MFSLSLDNLKIHYTEVTWNKIFLYIMALKII